MLIQFELTSRARTTSLHVSPFWILLIGMAVVVGGILVFRLHAFLALIAGALIVALLTPQSYVYRSALHGGATEAAAVKLSHQTIGERVAEGFGRTATEIGILIAMAAILGKTLMVSGAAERIVFTCRRMLGDRHASVAFLISSFILAALVLSDTTFYLLIPLAQVMRLRSGRDYTLYVLAIVAGATMTHSLVPPAAGPAAVAAELHVDLFPMIIGGIAIGAVASSSGYLFALWANRNWDIPLRPCVGVSQAELDRLANREETSLPPLALSLTPIVVPVMLIAARAIAGSNGDNSKLRALSALGEKNVALAIAATIGLLIVWSRTHATDRKSTLATIAESLTGAGVMVLIISAGGAFGHMLRQTDVADSIKGFIPASRLALLPLAFLIATSIRTAQGSAIVAMITTAGIVSPLASAHSLGFHPVYLALAIGCGSKPIMWMNDAGFWIINRMSGLTESETLKTASLMMAIMGVVGLAATMLGAWLLPFA